MDPSLILSIVYGTTWSFIIFVAAIYCFWKIWKSRKNSNVLTASTSIDEQTDIAGQTGTTPNTADDINVAIAANQSSSNTDKYPSANQSGGDDNDGKAGVVSITQNGNKQADISKCKLFISFMKEWGKSMWHQKKIYGSIFPHIFDQATDIGVILEYYQQWQHQSIDDDAETNPMWFFFVSVFIVLVQRIVSTSTIYALTKRPLLAFYQLFDLLMVRAVWINHKLGLTKPCNPQRYIELLVE